VGTLFFSLAAHPRLQRLEYRPTSRKEAEARFTEGLALHDAGKDEQARLKFTPAYSMFPSPAILFNLARSEQLSGKNVDAALHYRRFLREPEHPKVTADMRAKARGYLAEVTRVVAQVKIEARKTAKIIIDGKPMDEPLEEPVAVAPGKHVIEARVGADTERLEIDAAAGSTTPAHFKTEDATPLPPGGLGEPVTTTTYWPPPTSSIILGAVGIVGIGVGTGFALSASSKSSDLSSQPTGICSNPTSPACQSRQDTIDSRNTAKTVSTVSFVVGGVALAGAVVTWLVWPRTETTSRVGAITPWFGPQGAGASWTLRL
jgi:hypothetical protein